MRMVDYALRREIVAKYDAMVEPRRLFASSVSPVECVIDERGCDFAQVV